ncbi:MAG: hypothetical protein D6819_08030 [Gammaproteobacteria bacterium]|nr:MAG: hypothetical protein D6819_08030 [Gammaproteobacteria bacterium]
MRPDFAHTDLSPLKRGDIRFLLERFPAPAGNYEAIARQLDGLPDTLENMLRSTWVTEAVLNRQQLLLDVSPFLLFSVLLRLVLPDHRGTAERRVLNYMANLLALFARGDRLWRVSPGDKETHAYLVELMAAAAEEPDPKRRFAIHAHIGNHTLFITGLFPGWLAHRHRFGRRPVSPSWYLDAGSGHYGEAARQSPARNLGLDDVLLRLAMRFEHYRDALERMGSTYLAMS